MTFLPAFAVWQFALAGVLCAAAPILIHLWNRKRFRVVNWAAMELLREANRRSYRFVRIRDAILMLLRTAAVAMFGIALARPYFATPSDPLAPGQAIHAVLLVDNSLSMGYQTLAGTLLDQAKFRAATFIERLPPGSRVSVIPLCGSTMEQDAEPLHYATRYALEGLERIEVVDRSAGIRQALNAAQRAAESSLELPARYVLFSDQQRINFRELTSLSQERDLPELQIVDVAAEQRENTWIERLDVPDSVVDSQTSCTIVAEIRHRGREPRGDVRVALWVNDEEVDSRVVRLATSEATQEVTFEYVFRAFQPEPTQPLFVPIKVSLAPDRLPEDDQRYAMVPVVAALPVAFVDQYGAEGEKTAENRLGETRHLRQLLAPAISRAESARQLIKARHLRIDQLNRGVLADARLVVIAGVTEPGGQVELLREYVEQGGQLMIAAGAEFDPAAWNTAAWLNAAGILPLPLLSEPIGNLPEDARRDLDPLQLSYESFGQHPYFQLPGNSEQELRDLFAEPFFFKAVAVDESQSMFKALAQSIEIERARQVSPSTAADAPASSTTRHAPWLAWSALRDDHQPTLDELQPHVLARLGSSTGPPFIVTRRIGEGRTVLVTSGVLSSWNTLPKTNAVVLFDRMLRDMLLSSIPTRNFPGVARISIPIPHELRDASIVLNRPGTTTIEETLEVGFLHANQLGVTIERPLTRGVYRIRVRNMPEAAAADSTRRHWQFDAAVNGDAEESNLEALDWMRWEPSASLDRWHWLKADDPIHFTGTGVRGHDLWWWLALVVLMLLLTELVVLSAVSHPAGNKVSSEA